MEVSNEQQRAERFLNAFNAIDKHLRDATNSDSSKSFSSALNQFAQQGWFRHADQLQAFNDLRNVIVHRRYSPGRFLSVPTMDVVEEIEAIRDGLLKPERVLPRFQRDVVSVSASDSLMHVLQLISRYDFSQFPVYHEDRFHGLLTENGITRWLAHHVQQQMSLVELADESVATALGDEEERRNVQFTARDALLDEALYDFSENLALEAILITHSGNSTQSLLGIITRWDVLAYSNH